jgi:hypothetical protein
MFGPLLQHVQFLDHLQCHNAMLQSTVLRISVLQSTVKRQA